MPPRSFLDKVLSGSASKDSNKFLPPLPVKRKVNMCAEYKNIILINENNNQNITKVPCLCKKPNCVII